MQGHTTGRCQKTFSDEMGRWCSTTYSRQNGRQLTVISAYQVCDSPPVADTSNPTTSTMKTKARTQQYSMMVEKGLPLDRHPRQQFTPRATVRKPSPMKWAAGAAPHIRDKMGTN
jgi:hypothetical protein